MSFVKAGATGVSTIVSLFDDAGLPVTGKVAATFPATYYERVGESLPAAITLVDLAAQNSAWASGGLKELTGGDYRLDVPNAAFATAAKVRLNGEGTNLHLVHDLIDCGLDLSGTTVGTVSALAAAALDNITTTAPTGVASNFREMIVQTWRRFFKKATQTDTQLITYADNGTTVITTQAVSDDGTTENQGAAA